MTTPSCSAFTSFISFIASRMQRVWPCPTASPSSTKGGAPGDGRTVEGADHRRLDPDHAGIERRRRRGGRGRLLLGGRSRRRRGGDDALLCLGRPPDGDAEAGVLDRHLADAGVLDDADDLADPLGAARVDPGPLERLLGAAAADRVQERLGVVSEEREQQELLLARGETLVSLAELVEVGCVLPRRPVREAAKPPGRRQARWRREASRSGPRSAPVARRRRSGSAPPRARAGAPARPALARSEPRAAASRPRRGWSPARRSPRRAGRRPPVSGGGGRSPRSVRPEGCAGGPGGDARRERRDGLVADVLVDQVRCPPEGLRGDARLEAEAVQDARQRLAGGAVEDEGDGVHGAGEQVDARAGGLDRSGERTAARALAVEPDRQVARLADRLDQLADTVRLERAGRIVDQDAGGAELREALAPGRRVRRSRRRAPGCRRGRRRTRARRR